MIRRVIAGAERVLGLHAPGRNLAVFPDDTFLVSYPKSGNTWARFLIANLIHPGEKIDFSNVNRIIPGPEVTRNRELMLPLLLLPISIPAVVSMTRATTGILTGEFVPIVHIKFLAAYCVVFTAACFLLFDMVLNAE